MYIVHHPGTVHTVCCLTFGRLLSASSLKVPPGLTVILLSLFMAVSLSLLTEAGTTIELKETAFIGLRVLAKIF